MPVALANGSRGADVGLLQQRLVRQGYAAGPADGIFGPDTHRALLQFQRDANLLADGIAGMRTLAALRLAAMETDSVLDELCPARVRRLFPHTKISSIEDNLPHIMEGLREFGLVDRPMALMALSTVRAECEAFTPQDERPSRYSCSPDCEDFDLYDNRTDLGNRGAPDGRRYRGRGFVQLTGRVNYRRIGRLIGMDGRLEEEPGLAGEPATAGRILAAFLCARERIIKEALLEGDLARARRLVNGGSHGLDRFTDCYRRGERLFERRRPKIAGTP